MTTPILQLDELAAAQNQPEVLINRDLRKLEAVIQLTVLDKDLATPPGSPSDGDRYIVASGATDDWAGHEHEIAYYSGGWRFVTPLQGWIAFVQDEAKFYSYSGTWAELSVGGSGGTSLTVTNLGSPGQIVENTGTLVFSGAEVSDAGNGVAVVTINAGDGGGGGGGSSNPEDHYTIVAEAVANGSTNIVSVGMGTITTAGNTAMGLILPNLDIRRSIQRVVSTSNTSTNSSASFRTSNDSVGIFRSISASPRGGGFRERMIFAFSECRSDQRMFAGLASTSGAFTSNQEPSSQTNIIGIAKDQTDANLQFIHNDGSGSATKIDLGIAWDQPSYFFDFTLECIPPGNSITYVLKELHSGTQLSGSVNTDLPDQNVQLFTHIVANTGSTTSTAVQTHFYRIHREITVPLT
jgi:hypothetical protein